MYSLLNLFTFKNTIMKKNLKLIILLFFIFTAQMSFSQNEGKPVVNEKIKFTSISGVLQEVVEGERIYYMCRNPQVDKVCLIVVTTIPITNSYPMITYDTPIDYYEMYNLDKSRGYIIIETENGRRFHPFLPENFKISEQDTNEIIFTIDN